MNVTTKVPIETGAELLSLPELMKKKRSELGLTQKELADAAGISISALKQYETGRQEPTIPKVRKIASALGLSANEIWSETDVGSVGDEQLRLAVLQEVTTFITGTANSNQLQSLRDVLAEMSGISDSENTSAVKPKSAIDKLIDLIGDRGTSGRSLPKLLASAKAELEEMEMDALEELVADNELKVAHDYEASDTITDDQIDMFIESILVAIIYEFDISELDLEALEKIVVFLNEDEIQIKDNGFGILNDEDEYRERLLDEVPNVLLDNAMQRKFLSADLLKNL